MAMPTPIRTQRAELLTAGLLVLRDTLASAKVHSVVVNGVFIQSTSLPLGITTVFSAGTRVCLSLIKGSSSRRDRDRGRELPFTASIILESIIPKRSRGASSDVKTSFL